MFEINFLKRSAVLLGIHFFVILFFVAGVPDSYAFSVNHEWAKRLGGIGTDEGYGVTSDVLGNVYFVGLSIGNADLNGDGDSTDGGAESSVGYGSTDIVISSFDSSGTYRWSKRLGGTSTDEGRSVSVDSLGNIYVVGYVTNNADLNGDRDSTDGGAESSVGYGGYDIVMSVFDLSGTYRLSERLGGALLDFGVSITADPFGHIYTAGHVTGNADLNGDRDSTDGGAESSVGYGSTDIFLVGYSVIDPPFLSLDPVDPSGYTLPNITGTATDEGIVAQVEYQVDSTSGSWTACSADDGAFNEANETFTCSLPDLPFGLHTVYVRGLDDEGNYTEEENYGSSSFEYLVSPVSIFLDPVNSSVYTLPNITGTATDEGIVAQVEYQVDSTSGSWTACSADDGAFNEANETFTCSLPDLPFGLHTVYVRGLDDEGNYTGLDDHGSADFVYHMEITILHEFDYTYDGISGPNGTFALVDGILYGLTRFGGSDGAGTIYSIRPNGSDFTILHEFNAQDEGSEPYQHLLFLEGVLYGVTINDGVDGYGTIFAINPDGSDFRVLHEFNGSDGGFRTSGLINVNGILYGTRETGGGDDAGVIYSINPDGTNFTIVYEFEETAGNPHYGSLLFFGGNLYGTTYYGGSDDDGTIYSIRPDGSNFTILHELEFSDDGSHVPDSLILVGNVLYGMTTYGGEYGYGIIFSIDPTGTNYTILHSFDRDHGAYPYGSLIAVGSVLYGMTTYGGANNSGVFFSIGSDGSDFSAFHHFLGDDDGANPSNGSLMYLNNVLYGVTSQGGISDSGTIFSFTFPTEEEENEEEEQPQEENKNQPSYDLNKPKDLTLNCSSKDKRILLTWKDDSKEEEGNIIQRKINDGSWKTVKTSKTENREDWTDNNLEPNMYTYRVRSFYDNDESHYSNEAYCTIEASRSISLATVTTTPTHSSQETIQTTEKSPSQDQTQDSQKTTKDSMEVKKNNEKETQPILTSLKQSLKTIPSQIPESTSAVGILTGLLTLAGASSIPFFSLTPQALRGNAFMLLGGVIGRRKQKDWGTVFDSETKRPISGVIISLRDQQGKVKNTAVSDPYGRYGFLTTEGLFTLSITKGSYTLNTSSRQDPLYGSLYQGQTIEIHNKEEMITQNLSLDPQGVEWKQFAESVIKQSTSYGRIFLKYIALFLYAAGFLYTLVVTLFFPNIANLSLLLFYAVLFFLMLRKRRHFGIVTKNDSPVPFAQVELYKDNQRMKFAITDTLGRYYLLAPSGHYALKVQGTTLAGESFEKNFSVNCREGVLRDDVRL